MNNNTVLIVTIGDTGNESEAIRQALENFGYLVVSRGIGRPKELTDILEGTFPIDFKYLIISCHGDDGAIIMPELGADIYYPNEHRGSFPYSVIERHLRLTGKTIINLGCTTGYPEMCAAFAKGNSYIAPADYVDGKSAVFFVFGLFYELSKGASLESGFAKTKSADGETGLFVLA